jgi:hypothetical protein
MTVLNLPTQITIESLAETVAQLPPDMFDNFLAQIRAIRQRQVEEGKLLAIINRQLPAEQQRRAHELRAKLEAETLNAAESAELAEIVNRIEAADVERAEAIVSLAQQRRTTVRQLMRDLGLEPKVA